MIKNGVTSDEEAMYTIENFIANKIKVLVTSNFNYEPKSKMENCTVINTKLPTKTNMFIRRLHQVCLWANQINVINLVKPNRFYI